MTAVKQLYSAARKGNIDDVMTLCENNMFDRDTLRDATRLASVNGNHAVCLYLIEYDRCSSFVM